MTARFCIVLARGLEVADRESEGGDGETWPRKHGYFGARCRSIHDESLSVSG